MVAKNCGFSVQLSLQINVQVIFRDIGQYDRPGLFPKMNSSGSTGIFAARTGAGVVHLRRTSRQEMDQFDGKSQGRLCSGHADPKATSAARCHFHAPCLALAGRQDWEPWFTGKG